MLGKAEAPGNRGAAGSVKLGRAGWMRGSGSPRTIPSKAAAASS